MRSGMTTVLPKPPPGHAGPLIGTVCCQPGFGTSHTTYVPGLPAPRGRVCLIALLAVLVPIHVAATHVRMPNGVVIITVRPGVILGDGRDERRGDQGEQYHESAHRSLHMSERLPEEGALRPQ